MEEKQSILIWMFESNIKTNMKLGRAGINLRVKRIF